MKYSLDTLETAQVKLTDRFRGASADHDYLSRKLPGLLIGHVLGVITDGEIEETRKGIASARQVIEEMPAALAALKIQIEEARAERAGLERISQAAATRQEYLQLRDRIISAPDLAAKGQGGKLLGLSLQADKDVVNEFTSRPAVKFNEEARALVESATDFIRYGAKQQGTAFSFKPMI